jgi:2-oxoglutarate ferredoxin oxidoreductase subunit gamma
VANRTEIRIGGSGGQGIVLAAQILGKAAVIDGNNALQTQTYGAEARGSLTKSEVIISDSKIGFPAVRRCDILVTLNQESLDAFLKDLKETGTLIVDSTNTTAVPKTVARVHKIPATETAKKTFGETMYANMIILGALAKTSNLASRQAIEKAIKEAAPERTIDINIKAFRKGYDQNYSATRPFKQNTS